MNNVLSGYVSASAELTPRFEAISTAELFAPVRDLLPTMATRVVDIGAGTGRDAAWFAGNGHQVLAVEPVQELRAAGIALHKDVRITWLDDRLPELSAVMQEPRFDLVILSAVWQHLDEDDRAVAIRHLGQMTSHGGLLIMSLRHGEGIPDRKIFPVSVETVVDSAKHEGFDVVRAAKAASVQAGNRAAGVQWTWLALQKMG